MVTGQLGKRDSENETENKEVVIHAREDSFKKEEWLTVCKSFGEVK